MSPPLIESLLPHLPRCAEEDGDFYSVPRGALIDALCQGQALEPAIAENTVALLETLLDTLAVLDRNCLQNGEWRFVSFPAQLLATSVLTAMSDGDSRLFAANFWNTQAIGNEQKDRQRDVLRVVELARQEHHASRQAQPIRYCYVAWSIIKLDGRILFYQREDTKKRYDKAAGDYGLLGGRCNQNDVAGITDKAALLRALQSANSQRIKDALPQTLQRELWEEAGLQFGEHYAFKLWRRLEPYQQVQGAAPNHALTDYYLDIFQIELTLDGYLFLQHRLKDDERLAWLALADIESGQFTDGKIPYIKALYDDFGADRTALSVALSALPDSFGPGYLFAPNKYGITLPIDLAQPVLSGVLGKEKPLALSLSSSQLRLVLGLAAHLRGFAFAELDEHIGLHPFGWIEVSDSSALRSQLIHLATLLNSTDLLIENRCDRFFRLSITPEVIFFADTLFSCSVRQADLAGVRSKIPLTLHRRAFATAFGTVSEKTAVFKLTLNHVHDLQKLSTTTHTTDNEAAVKIEDAYKKRLHQDPAFIAMGLRNMLRQEGGCFKFAVAFSST